ncbi:MAG: DUF2029 domain-containing protein [Rhizobiales bacterium]|nr:DUF2029 domain-containing protein [Hyphomicrobiales bacterium]
MTNADIGIARPVLRPPRILLIAAVLMSLYQWLVLITTIPYPGKIGLDYNTLGTDWMVFYGAIRSVLDGHSALIYDGTRFTDFLNTAFADWLSRPLDFRPWTYPPDFLVFLLPFAPLGFLGSYVAFQIVSAGLLVVALRSFPLVRMAGGMAIAMVLLYPAVTINVISGQCTFLVAALIVGGFALLDSRPIWGGLILGLLTFKPQFCVLVPFALIAAGSWRALIAAAVSPLVMVGLSGLMFGWDLWIRWIPLVWSNVNSSNDLWIETGRMWGNSVYACVASLGAPTQVASAVQLVAIGVAIVAVVTALRSRLGAMERAAVFLAATVLAAPHSGLYDMVLLQIAMTFLLLARDPLRQPWMWSLAFVVWLLPTLGPPLLFGIGRLGPLVPIALVLVALFGARSGGAGDNEKAPEAEPYASPTSG